MESHDLVIWLVKLGDPEWVDDHPEMQEIGVAANTASEACELALEWERESIGDDLKVVGIKISHSFVVRK